MGPGEGQPGPRRLTSRGPGVCLLLAVGLSSFCLRAGAFGVGSVTLWPESSNRRGRSGPEMKAQSVAHDASIMHGVSIPPRPVAPPPIQQPNGQAAGVQQRTPPQKRSPTEAQASRESQWMRDLERLQQTKDREALRAYLRNVEPPQLLGGSLALCEKLVVAAAVCNEYEVLSEALDTLLNRAQGRNGWNPGYATFSTVLNAYRRAKDVTRLMRYFKGALAFTGFSKTVLLNIVLAGLCETGQGGTATYYIQVAREKWGIEPNEISWNTLLGWATRIGRVKLVADLEAKMAEEGIEGDVFTNNIRLQYLLSTKPEAGVALFEELKQRRLHEEQRREGRSEGRGRREGSSMDPVTVNIMTDYIAKTRGVDEAMALVLDMERSLHLRPAAVTHNILLDALFKSSQVDRALEYFNTITAAAGLGGFSLDNPRPPPSFAPPPRITGLDSTTFDILLSGLVQSGRVSVAAAVHQLMRWARLRPTIYTFAALVRMQKTATDVYRVWAQARSSCPRLTVPFLNILVHELGHTHRSLSGACCAFSAISGLRMRPSIISYNSLIAALMRDGNLTAIVELPSVSEEQALAPSASGRGPSRGRSGVQDTQVCEFGDLAMSLVGMTKLEAALKVVRSLYEPSSRVRPNARTFTILMAGVTRAQMGPQGRALCLALYQESLTQGVSANGLLCHTLLRGFGGDASGALNFFKNQLRPQLKAEDRRVEELLSLQGRFEEDEEEAGEEGRLLASAQAGDVQDEEEGLEEEEEGEAPLPSSSASSVWKEASYDRHRNNLLLGYRALLHVCGVGGRPDLALQVFYAMVRDGLAPGVRAWDAYVAGKETQPPPSAASMILMRPYESLLRNEAAAWAEAETGWKRIRIRF